MRLNISIPDADLETIDMAAEAAGETRSAYMAEAALLRVRAEGKALTSAQKRQVIAAVRDAVGKL